MIATKRGVFYIFIPMAILAACSSKPSETSQNQDAGQTRAGSAPASQGEEPRATASPDPRTIPMNVQGVAAVGLTVRVKGVELGTDATMLTVSASYGGTNTNDVKLASDATYLQDEQGNKLMLKPPQDNPELNIVRGQQLDGMLVFLGAIAPGARHIKLVLNDGNPGDSIIAPGLTIDLPLETSAR